MEKIRDLGVLTGYCALIYYLSAQPSLPVEQLFPHQDKLIHAVAYAGMGVFAFRSFRHYIGNPSLLAVFSIGFCSLYGLSDEIHQYFVPGRSADVFDLIADITGAVLSQWLIRMANLLNPRFQILSVRPHAKVESEDRKA